MKQITSIFLILISFTAFSFSTDYNTLVKKALEYEKNKQYVHAIGMYYEAMETDNTYEDITAYEGYKNLFNAIRNGKSGLEEYDIFDLYDGWIALLKDAESFFAENLPFTLTYDFIRGELNYDRRTYDYSVLLKADTVNGEGPSILNLIKYGLKKSYQSGWTKIPKNWPVKSVYTDEGLFSKTNFLIKPVFGFLDAEQSAVKNIPQPKAINISSGSFNGISNYMPVWYFSKKEEPVLPVKYIFTIEITDIVSGRLLKDIDITASVKSNSVSFQNAKISLGEFPYKQEFNSSSISVCLKSISFEVFELPFHYYAEQIDGKYRYAYTASSPQNSRTITFNKDKVLSENILKNVYQAKAEKCRAEIERRKQEAKFLALQKERETELKEKEEKEKKEFERKQKQMEIDEAVTKALYAERKKLAQELKNLQDKEVSVRFNKLKQLFNTSDTQSENLKIPEYTFSGEHLKIEVESMKCFNFELITDELASESLAAKLLSDRSQADVFITFPAGSYFCYVNVLAPDDEHDCFHLFIDENAYRLLPHESEVPLFQLTTRAPVRFSFDKPTTAHFMLKKDNPANTNRPGETGMTLDYLLILKMPGL